MYVPRRINLHLDGYNAFLDIDRHTIDILKFHHSLSLGSRRLDELKPVALVHFMGVVYREHVSLNRLWSPLQLRTTKLCIGNRSIDPVLADTGSEET